MARRRAAARGASRLGPEAPEAQRASSWRRAAQGPSWASRRAPCSCESQRPPHHAKGGNFRGAPDDVVLVRGGAPDDVVLVQGAPHDVVFIVRHGAPDDVLTVVEADQRGAP